MMARFAIVSAVALGAGLELRAQEVPVQEATEDAPAASTFTEATNLGVPTSREAELEDRVRQLEAMVNQLTVQMQSLSTAPTTINAGSPAAPGDAAPDVGNLATTVAPSQMGGVAAPGQSLPPNPPPSSKYDSPAPLERKPSNVIFGPGFEIRSDDDEYIFQVHNLTQFEYRGYKETDHATQRDSFLIPRQWWMFSGRITRPFGYFVSFANGFDSMSMLDAFLDYEFDPRFRIRAGRFKGPFLYEFFTEPTQGWILPERSVFFNNFGQNRDLGVMAFGRLFNNTFDYATGIFNGSRNGFVASTNSKSMAAYINWMPLVNDDDSIFRNFNIGGSVFGGDSDRTPSPTIFRTVVPMAGNAVAGVPFLAFNGDVREVGPRQLWALHSAYYLGGLAVQAEWSSGFQDYAKLGNLASRTHLPVQAFHVESGYLLTGETRSNIGLVKPLRPFSLKPGNFGLGAWELTGRYQMMNLGKEVFSNGLVDPNLWTDGLWITDLGFNWHINQYLKFYFEWEHAEFNQPVFTNVGQRGKTSNLFLARIQLYF